MKLVKQQAIEVKRRILNDEKVAGTCSWDFTKFINDHVEIRNIADNLNSTLVYQLLSKKKKAKHT